MICLWSSKYGGSEGQKHDISQNATSLLWNAIVFLSFRATVPKQVEGTNKNLMKVIDYLPNHNALYKII